jgi:outer membrane protein OmpA-like peptidoglycan-associated protein
LTIALTAYTFKTYVLGASYQLLGSNDKPALAVGINDIGIKAHVGPLGNDSIFPDEKYRPNAPTENFSAFVVTSVPTKGIFRLHAGLGRGRYVGYSSGLSKYLNLGILLGGRHQWDVGLFGGVEARIGSHVSVVLEDCGRDVNAGVKANLGPVSVDLALTKIEGFTNPTATQFPRVSAAVTYQLNGLMGGHPGPQPQPGPVVVVPPKPGTLSGKVVNKITGSPLSSAQVILTPSEPHDPSEVQTVTTDPSGNYSFPDVRPGSYDVSVSSPGYVSQSSEHAVVASGTTRWDVGLDPEKIGTQPTPGPVTTPKIPTPATTPPVSGSLLHMKSIYFRFDRYDLSDAALLTLKDNAEIIKQHPGTKIALLGRCDEVGTEEYNLKLGERRARAAYDYLLKTGIEPARLSFRSLGKQKAEANG